MEESGNMLVLATAIAVVDGNADYACPTLGGFDYMGELLVEGRP